jgi:hypothetical protein
VVPLGEYGTKPISIEAAEERFPILVFLFNPVIQVAGLQLGWTSGKAGKRHS